VAPTSKAAAAAATSERLHCPAAPLPWLRPCRAEISAETPTNQKAALSGAAFCLRPAQLRRAWVVVPPSVVGAPPSAIGAMNPHSGVAENPLGVYHCRQFFFLFIYLFFYFFIYFWREGICLFVSLIFLFAQFRDFVVIVCVAFWLFYLPLLVFFFICNYLCISFCMGY
jgi:hypothetical protein